MVSNTSPTPKKCDRQVLNRCLLLLRTFWPALLMIQCSGCWDSAFLRPVQVLSTAEESTAVPYKTPKRSKHIKTKAGSICTPNQMGIRLSFRLHNFSRAFQLLPVSPTAWLLGFSALVKSMFSIGALSVKGLYSENPVREMTSYSIVTIKYGLVPKLFMPAACWGFCCKTP